MSFILDALRKSETERQRQSGPGLVDAGYRPPVARRGLWLPLLVVVLGANLGLMAYFWLRDAPDPDVPAAATPAPAAAPVRVPSPAPVGRSLAAETGAPAGAEAEFAAIADLPAVESEPYTETLEPPPSPPPAAEAAPATAARSSIVEDTLPTAEQLVATGALSGQALHLDIHVYSSNPAERFVFINMRKYTEGMQLPDGPRLEEITPEGAVFNQNGQRFLLARD